jgi:hypothetical protein
MTSIWSPSLKDPTVATPFCVNFGFAPGGLHNSSAKPPCALSKTHELGRKETIYSSKVLKLRDLIGLRQQIIDSLQGHV